MANGCNQIRSAGRWIVESREGPSRAEVKEHKWTSRGDDDDDDDGKR